MLRHLEIVKLIFTMNGGRKYLSSKMAMLAAASARPFEKLPKCIEGSIPAATTAYDGHKNHSSCGLSGCSVYPQPTELDAGSRCRIHSSAYLVVLRPPGARGSEIYEHDSTAVSTGRLCTLYDFRSGQSFRVLH